MTIVTNATILEQACLLLGAATDEVCLTSPWISEGKLRGLLEAITQVGVRVRVVFRISKSGDLNITRANALKILRERPDTDIRYSQAVHAKTILVDGKNGIISSSNITRAGMSKDGNQEMGVTVNGVQAQDAQNVFEAIWASSTRLPAECVGFLLNPTSAHRLTFVALDPGLSMGTLVRVELGSGWLLGRVTAQRRWNRGFFADPYSQEVQPLLRPGQVLLRPGHELLPFWSNEPDSLIGVGLLQQGAIKIYVRILGVFEAMIWVTHHADDYPDFQQPFVYIDAATGRIRHSTFDEEVVRMCE